ncbi:MAG: sporulation protein YunB [Eubacteriales bacterium]|nr:sporulation protein YunB [Eubacteriales bacterium]
MPKITHFYIGRRKRTPNKFIILSLLLVSILLILYIYILNNNVYPVLLEVAESKTEYIGETVVNGEVLDYITSNKVSYDKLYNINTSKEGKITSIEANTYEITKIKTELVIRIQEAINSSDDMFITIPLLSATGNVFLSDIGPKVRVNLILSGDNKTEIKTEFKSVGYNQTKHDIYVEFSYRILAVIPGKRAETYGKCKIPIVSTIIVGEVPNTIVDINR